MASEFTQVKTSLSANPQRWCVTGAAGFIGSHLVESLLLLKQRVVGLDNLSTGKLSNLNSVKKRVGDELFKNFEFVEGDITDRTPSKEATSGCRYILHQAALGSVPRSIKDPVTSVQANVEGFVSMLQAARENGVKRFVYASSSSVYGDSADLPKREEKIGNQLSPYALTKYCNEKYAELFASQMNLCSVGLRYFNVFGPRQDPEGAYAAVIPKWIGELLAGHTPTIFGDGKTSRDFCYVSNAVEANILAAVTENRDAFNRVYNVACGEQTTLSSLYSEIREHLVTLCKREFPEKPNFAEFRAGDVRHSLADISAAKTALGFSPELKIKAGLKITVESFLDGSSA